MITTRIDRANVFSYAWQLVKTLGYTLSEALKCAWANAKFYARVQSETLHFVFKKIDGTIREAWGTLSRNIVPPTQGTRTASKDVQVYFDVEANGWRSFKRANLLNVY